MKKLMFLLIMLALLTSQAWAEVWSQTNWSGGSGYWLWADPTCFWEESGLEWHEELRIAYWFKSPKEWAKEDVSILYEAEILEEGTLAVGTNTGQVFFSLDGGWTWEERGTFENLARVYSLAFDSFSGTIWVAGVSKEAQAAVFYSLDGGWIWEEGELPAPHEDTDLGEILLASTGELYLTRLHGYGWPYKGEVLKSTDGGRIWDTTATLPKVTYAFSLAEVEGEIYVSTTIEESSFWLEIGERPRPLGATCEVFRLEGESWVATGFPDTVKTLYDLAATAEGIMAGVMLPSEEAGVFSYSKARGWRSTTPLNQGNGAFSVYETEDGVWWAGLYGFSEGGIFKSEDSGETWEATGGLPGSCHIVMSFSEGQDRILATTAYGAYFLKGENTTGYLESSVYPAGPANWGIINWVASTNDQEIMVKVRTSPDSAMSEAVPWESCPSCVSGQDISSLSSVQDGHLFVQNRVEMNSDNPEVSPVLREIAIEYEEITGSVEENEEVYAGPPRLNIYPNPMKVGCLIRFSGQLEIYDLSGRLIRSLKSQDQVSWDWDGRNEQGRKVSSGVYFVRLQNENYTASKKLVVVR